MYTFEEERYVSCVDLFSYLLVQFQNYYRQSAKRADDEYHDLIKEFESIAKDKFRMESSGNFAKAVYLTKRLEKHRHLSDYGNHRMNTTLYYDYFWVFRECALLMIRLAKVSNPPDLTRLQSLIDDVVYEMLRCDVKAFNGKNFAKEVDYLKRKYC